MREQRARDSRPDAAAPWRRIAAPRIPANGAKPRGHHRLGNRLARLQNERARLERELVICESRRQAAASRLAEVSTELAALQPTLFEAPRTYGGPPLHRRRTPLSRDLRGATCSRSGEE
jgi:hypothetical protein